MGHRPRASPARRALPPEESAHAGSHLGACHSQRVSTELGCWRLGSRGQTPNPCPQQEGHTWLVPESQSAPGNPPALGNTHTAAFHTKIGERERPGHPCHVPGWTKPVSLQDREDVGGPFPGPLAHTHPLGFWVPRPSRKHPAQPRSALGSGTPTCSQSLTCSPVLGGWQPSGGHTCNYSGPLITAQLARSAAPVTRLGGTRDSAVSR